MKSTTIQLENADNPPGCILLNNVEYVRSDRVQILIDALYGLSMPCTRANYTVARLDEIVCMMAKSALYVFENTK